MILVTGGAGYIGSHTCAALAQANESFMIIDNFSNSTYRSLDRLGKLLGDKPLCIEGDVRDGELLLSLFRNYPITDVIHFAASKYVGESIAKPQEYYDNNMVGLLSLLNVMKETKVKNLVFSSSAGVYGNPQHNPVTEQTPMRPISPYGHTKAMGEQILIDLEHQDPSWRFAALRYFNPIGAHESGLLGEEALGVPNNLMPYITKVAAKELPYLQVFGDDYPTVDGSAVRDYLHVMDLAQGHVEALQYIRTHNDGLLTLNFGAGHGVSVLEIIHAFEKVTDIEIPYKITPRREGDSPECWADTALAAKVLNWKSQHNLEQMLSDAWRWQCQMKKGG